MLYDLEVPDFSKEKFVMSGVALTSRAAAEAPTVKPKDPLADYLPGPPTTMREFTRDDTVALFAEFYENMPGAQAHMLEFKAELRAEGGRVVQTVTDRAIVHRSAGRFGRLRILGAAAAGRGRARSLRASTSKARRAPAIFRSVSRDIQIRVR